MGWWDGEYASSRERVEYTADPRAGRGICESEPHSAPKLRNFALKGGSLCLALKVFSARLIAICVGQDMEWVRAFVGSFEIRLDASELENRRKNRMDIAVISTIRLILQIMLRRRVVAPS